MEYTRSLKLLRWKVWIGIGKSEVEKFEPRLGSFWLLNTALKALPTSIGNFQLRWNLSNFGLSNFSYFQTILSNYMWPNLCGCPSKVCVFGGFPPNEIYQPDQTVLYGTGKLDKKFEFFKIWKFWRVFNIQYDTVFMQQKILWSIVLD